MPLPAGASDRDATRSERSRCDLEGAIATPLERAVGCHSEREQCKPVWRRKWKTTLYARKQRLQGLAKGKLGAMVVLRFVAERWVVKWTVPAARRCPARRVSRKTERGSTMYAVEHEDLRVAAVCLSIAVLQVSDRRDTRTEESGSVNGKMTGKAGR